MYRYQRILMSLVRQGKITKECFMFRCYIVGEYVKDFALALREI
jgi:hypothetical protein